MVLSETFWAKTLRGTVGRLSVGLAVSYIAPIVIWALVSLRREYLEMIIPGLRQRMT
jgi:hypothetical protein